MVKKNISLLTIVAVWVCAGCTQPVTRVAKRTPGPVSATAVGLNQHSKLPVLEISEQRNAVALYMFFDGIDDNSKPGPAVDYNEKYKIIFKMSNGKVVTVITLYNDRDWHFDGEGGDRSLKPGLSEHLTPLFDAAAQENRTR